MTLYCKHCGVSEDSIVKCINAVEHYFEERPKNEQVEERVSISSELERLRDNNELALQLCALLVEVKEKVSGPELSGDSCEEKAPAPNSLISTFTKRNDDMRESLEHAISTARQINDSI